MKEVTEIKRTGPPSARDVKGRIVTWTLPPNTMPDKDWRWFFLQTRDTTVTCTPGHEHMYLSMIVFEMELTPWRAVQPPVCDTASVGIALVVSTAIGLAGGHCVDRWLGPAPWLTMIGLGVGIAAGCSCPWPTAHSAVTLARVSVGPGSRGRPRGPGSRASGTRRWWRRC